MIMGNRGRFGKYGEIKRSKRLREARIQAHQPSTIQPLRRKPARKERFGQKAGIRIRAGRPSDVRFIGRLSGQVFHVYGHYRETICQWYASEKTLTLIATQDGEPAGFAMLGLASAKEVPQDVSELLAIAVEPQRHRAGIGRALLLAAEKRAHDLGVKRIVLHTAIENIAAQKLFGRAEYCPWRVDRDFYPAGQDAVLMFKDIHPF